MNNKELQAIIEGALFISGDEGISFGDLTTILDQEKPSAIRKAIEELEVKYEKDQSSAFSIQHFAGNKYRLQTKPQFASYYGKLNVIEGRNKLTNAAIEVLSIIAFKGPITKTEIDEIRNSDSTYQIQKLREKELIMSVGKSDAIGSPNLYKITDNFYKVFNLNGPEEMPQVNLDDIKTSDMYREEAEEESKNAPRDIFGGAELDD